MSEPTRRFPTIPSIATPSEARAEFPAEPASAGRARRFVGDALERWSCDGLVDVATLLVSELVANAVLHAGTAIAVLVRLQGRRVRVEVHDGNAGTPARKHYSTLATTGRGLLLVERMSEDWGVTPQDRGKIVWFELDEAGPVRDVGLGMLDLDLDDLDDPVLAGGGDAPSPGGAGPGGPDDDLRPSLRVRVGSVRR